MLQCLPQSSCHLNHRLNRPFVEAQAEDWNASVFPAEIFQTSVSQEHDTARTQSHVRGTSIKRTESVPANQLILLTLLKQTFGPSKSTLWLN